MEKALVRKTLRMCVNGTNIKNLSQENQDVLNFIKMQYRDIYRITAEGVGLIVTKYKTRAELFPEFDQMSGDLLSFKGWLEISQEGANYYDGWQVGEIELKPLFSQYGLIHSVRGTNQWLSSNSEIPWKGTTRPISARVKYELPNGRICAFEPSFLGDSSLLKKADIEYRSSALNLEFTV